MRTLGVTQAIGLDVGVRSALLASGTQLRTLQETPGGERGWRGARRGYSWMQMQQVHKPRENGWGGRSRVCSGPDPQVRCCLCSLTNNWP